MLILQGNCVLKHKFAKLLQKMIKYLNYEQGSCICL
jgi:hypothetical protein